MILAGVGLTACVHKVSDLGVTSVQLLGPAAKPKQLQETEAAIRPNDDPEPVEARVGAEPIAPLAKPVYPARALAAHAGRVRLDRRIDIDVEGRVTQIEPSFLVLPETVPYAADFEQAIEVAVAKWKFIPAQVQVIQLLRRGDQPSVWRVLRTDATEDVVEVVFTFDSMGAVTSVWAKR